MGKLDKWKNDTVNGLNLYNEAIKLNSHELVMQDVGLIKETLGLTDEESFELVRDCYFHLLAHWDHYYESKFLWFKGISAEHLDVEGRAKL